MRFLLKCKNGEKPNGPVLICGRIVPHNVPAPLPCSAFAVKTWTQQCTTFQDSKKKKKSLFTSAAPSEQLKLYTRLVQKYSSMLALGERPLHSAAPKSTKSMWAEPRQWGTFSGYVYINIQNLIFPLLQNRLFKSLYFICSFFSGIQSV